MFNFSALRKMRCKGTENYWIATKKEVFFRFCLINNFKFTLNSTNNTVSFPRRIIIAVQNV